MIDVDVGVLGAEDAAVDLAVGVEGGLLVVAVDVAEDRRGRIVRVADVRRGPHRDAEPGLVVVVECGVGDEVAIAVEMHAVGFDVGVAGQGELVVAGSFVGGALSATISQAS